MKTFILLLPFFSGITLKLSVLIVDPKMMTTGLDDLLSYPRPSGESLNLDRNQRTLITQTLACASLRSTVVLTCLVSLFDAAIALLGHPVSSGAILFVILFILILVMIVWTITKQTPELLGKGPLGIPRSAMIVLCFCVIDVLLGVFAYLSTN
jgi:hypothetical protein